MCTHASKETITPYQRLEQRAIPAIFRGMAILLTVRNALMADIANTHGLPPHLHDYVQAMDVAYEQLNNGTGYAELDGDEIGRP